MLLIGDIRKKGVCRAIEDGNEIYAPCMFCLNFFRNHNGFLTFNQSNIEHKSVEVFAGAGVPEVNVDWFPRGIRY